MQGDKSWRIWVHALLFQGPNRRSGPTVGSPSGTTGHRAGHTGPRMTETVTQEPFPPTHPWRCPMPSTISRESALEFVKTEEYKSAQGKLNEMLARSTTDMEFRQKLLSDPRAAFAEVGESIPEGVELRFVENQADATIVLPDPVDPQAEL